MNHSISSIFIRIFFPIYSLGRNVVLSGIIAVWLFLLLYFMSHQFLDVPFPVCRVMYPFLTIIFLSPIVLLYF